MTAVAETACPRCRRARSADERSCVLCGHLFAAAALARTAATERGLVLPSAPASAQDRPRVPAAAGARTSDAGGAREAWLYLAIGLATAPVFALTPILRYAGWFLASLVHEIGHAAFAWLCGMPAVPAIALTGHAAAVHGEQNLFLLAMIAAGLATLCWRLLDGRARWCALAAVILVHAALALSGAKDLVHLLAGHGAELAFATLALWKALDGGFTASRAERALYGTVGWFLLGRNALLCFGLATSAASRAEYATNGSFGMTNDYLRAADEILGWRVESVALWMLAACALVLPLAIAMWRIGVRARDADIPL